MQMSHPRKDPFLTYRVEIESPLCPHCTPPPNNTMLKKIKNIKLYYMKIGYKFFKSLVFKLWPVFGLNVNQSFFMYIYSTLPTAFDTSMSPMSQTTSFLIVLESNKQSTSDLIRLKDSFALSQCITILYSWTILMLIQQ